MTRRALLRSCLLAIAMSGFASYPDAAFVAAQGKDSPRPAAKVPTVLFMCPHGAAKSVLASAYFQRLAKERGLVVHVKSAGTDPDPAVAPAVAAHLKKNGYEVPISRPQKATADDLSTADIVVSMGCDLSGYPAPRSAIVNWDEVPGPGENFTAADQAIRKRVTELVEQLVKRRSR